MTLEPNFSVADLGGLSAEDIRIITNNNMTQVAEDQSAKWEYESRRKAQQILDYLYLGPSSVVRDHSWLQREGITMIMVVRDARMARARLLSVDKASRELGIAAEYVDLTGPHEYVNIFPAVIKKINVHVVSVYRSQLASAEGLRHDQMALNPENIQRGKVLVVCETGNERSAVVVAAYIMAVFNQDMVAAMQFVGIQRFCVSFDEDNKRILQSWEDILQAQRSVGQALRSESAAQPNPSQHASLNPQPTQKAKRRIDETYGEEATDLDANFVLDRDRYTDRGAFAPFVDVTKSQDDMIMGE